MRRLHQKQNNQSDFKASLKKPIKLQENERQRVSYLWFQIELVLHARSSLKSHVWFQPKLHSTQFNYHYELNPTQSYKTITNQTLLALIISSYLFPFPKEEREKQRNQPTNKNKETCKNMTKSEQKTTKINHTIQSVRCCNGRTFICGPSVTIYMELILAFSCSLLSRSSAIVSLTPLPLGRDTCGLLVLPMMKMLLIRVANWWPVLSFTWTMSNEPGNDVHLLSYWLNDISLKAFSEANILRY